jgi:hypothetical protein
VVVRRMRRSRGVGGPRAPVEGGPTCRKCARTAEDPVRKVCFDWSWSGMVLVWDTTFDSFVLPF